MQQTPKINAVQIILIVVILAAVLARRFYFKNWNNDSLISFFVGAGTILIAFLIYKLIIKNKIKK